VTGRATAIMTDKIIYLTDRSAAETDDLCGMKFWWNRLSEGGGIVPRETPEALAVGAAIHDDFALLAEMPDISPAALQETVDALLAGLSDDDRLDQKRMEILYRRLGWFAGWGLYKEPQIRKGWENVSIEQELILDRDPLWVQVTPDRLLRNKELPDVFKYMEYKSALSASKKWLDSWRYQIQLHTSLKAVEEESGIAPKFAQVIGLIKGNYSYSDNRLTHPYVWGYYNSTTKSWTHEYEKARSAAWEKMPVWEYPGGVVEWAQRCGQDTANDQFPSTAPIFLDERMLNNWIRRRTAREQQVAIVKEAARESPELREVYFESRTSKCRPAYGETCPYLPLCWNAERAKNPLATGDFVKRTPHHDLEAIGVL
jgi:hypothetical protein